MKFGKEFKKQMVPEWIEAYMDYNGLKRMLREIRLFKQSKQPTTPARASQQRLPLNRAFSGLVQSRDFPSEGDIEDQVIAVNRMRTAGSRVFYKTKFLRQHEDGGENEVLFFRELDKELNKVNTFYKDKVEEMMHEAASLDKQMDALIALQIQVETPHVDGSNSTAHPSTNTATMSRTTALSGVRTSGRLQMNPALEVDAGCDNQLEEHTDGAEVNPDRTSNCISVCREDNQLEEPTDGAEVNPLRTSNCISACREDNQLEEPTDGAEVNPVRTSNCISVCREDNQLEEPTDGAEVNPDRTSNCISVCREEVIISDHKPAPLKILEHVKINNTLVTPTSTIKGVFKDFREQELSFEKAELRKVKERLNLVFIEFYQKLCLLRHYSFMNLSAFAKIMKKYEKITSRGASRSYMKIIDESYLGSSDEVTVLLVRVEVIFIKHFSNSNRREGMKLLRPKVKREKHSVTFFLGFFSGCLVVLLVSTRLDVETKHLMDKEEGTLYIENIFPLYSLFAYLVLHTLMYAGNIYFWRRYRINYPFIFGFKQGTELGYQEVFLLSTGLAVLALASFLAQLHMAMNSNTQTHKTFAQLIPLGLVTVVLVITFCPFNIIYRSSRFFLIHCIRRCICAPLYQVTLPDFFLADHLTSQVEAIRTFALYICYYGLREFSGRKKECHRSGAYNAIYFIVAFIPYWIRFLQCLRRLFEDKKAAHGFNGLKYFLTIVAVVIRTAFEIRKGMTWMVLALVSSAVATIMSTYWDIVIDWGLLRRQSKNFYLRDKLLVSHKSVYFAAMVLNILLRFAWLQMLWQFNLRSLHMMASSTIFSCLEIIRRGIWSFFRLENEHLNNVGQYRAFKSVPLPFNYNDEDKDD